MTVIATSDRVDQVASKTDELSIVVVITQWHWSYTKPDLDPLTVGQLPAIIVVGMGFVEGESENSGKAYYSNDGRSYILHNSSVLGG